MNDTTVGGLLDGTNVTAKYDDGDNGYLLSPTIRAAQLRAAALATLLARRDDDSSGILTDGACRELHDKALEDMAYHDAFMRNTTRALGLCD